MNSEKKTALVLAVAIAITVVAISVSLSVLDISQNETPTSSDDPENKVSKAGFKKAPELTGISGYINVMPDELKQQIENNVVLYDIWTYSCINCIRTLPFITTWDASYSNQGLLIIGIHSPEFEFEKDIENVKMAVAKYGIQYPVILDNDKEVWNAFQNHYWPRKYIADHEGYIRYDHIGEGKYEETENVIRQLLKERASSLGIQMTTESKLVEIDEFEHSWLRTPELYFGHKFAQGRNQLGNQEGFQPNKEVTYTIPQRHNLHNFYLEGTWLNKEGSMELVSDSGSILLPYKGKEVNIVTAGEADLQILIDGNPVPPGIAGKDVGTNGRVHTHHPGLYNIVSSAQSEEHTIEIIVDDKGFEIFTFTFG